MSAGFTGLTPYQADHLTTEDAVDDGVPQLKAKKPGAHLQLFRYQFRLCFSRQTHAQHDLLLMPPDVFRAHLLQQSSQQLMGVLLVASEEVGYLHRDLS